jgi:hypothetical protein
VCAAAVLLTACGSDAGSDPDRSGSATTAAANGEFVYFNPTYLPAGYKVESTDVQDDGKLESAAWTAKVGRAAGPKKFTDVVAVIVDTAPQARSDDAKGYTPVDVNGHRGQQVDSPITGAIVMWQQDGVAVGVLAPPGKHDDALGVARAVRLSADVTATRLENLPAGLEVIAQWGSRGFGRKRYTINTEATDAKGAIDIVRVDVAVVPSGFPAAVLGAGHEIDTSSAVRGHDGYAFRSVSDIGGGRTFEQFNLVWAERADLVVTVSGSVSLKELRAIAAGLKSESEQQWRSHMKVK